MDSKEVFESLVGKTLVSIEGAEKGSEEIILRTSDGLVYRMYHRQDCCESVSVEDVEGDILDVLREPIRLAEESSNEGKDDSHDYGGTSTWTFYRLATEFGFMVIRWLGESNGYYSESVDVEVSKDPDYKDPKAVWA